jgi:hypothetical protein
MPPCASPFMALASDGGTSAPAPPSPDIVAFSSLIVSLLKSTKQQQNLKFVKEMEEIPAVVVQPISREHALKLDKIGLIGQFTSIWPSPKSMAFWVERNWKPLIKGCLSLALFGKGCSSFHFEEKSDRDLIFRSFPYFMGSRGLYINSWMSDFCPKNDIPRAVLVWVKLPFLPLHCWNDETLQSIGNTLVKYIDRAEPNDGIQACARNCVEVDLEKDLP